MKMHFFSHSLIQLLFLIVAIQWGFISCNPLTRDQSKDVINKRSRAFGASTNRDPIAIPTTLTVKVYKDAGIQQITDLIAAIDPDGDEVFYAIITPPSKGVLSDCLGLNLTTNTDLKCRYKPGNGVVGLNVDQFSYAAYDRLGGSTIVTVKINVILNTPPVANNQTMTVIENGGTQSLGTLSPAYDVDGDNLTYLVTTFPGKGILSDCMGLNGSSNNDLICNYTPTTNLHGTDSFIYTVTDTRGGSSTGTITLSIQSTNGNPTATPNPVTVSVNYNLGFQVIDLTTLTSTLTITDPDGTPPDQLTYTVTTPPAHGLLKNCLGLPGSISPTPDFYCLYTPQNGIQGLAADQFFFTVSDQQGGSVVVQVVINSENQVPIPETSTKFFIEDDLTSTFSITINDLGENDIVKVEGLSPLNSSNVFTGALNSLGTIKNCMGLNNSTPAATFCSFIPRADAYGDETFTYQVTDLGGKTATGMITLSVAAVDDLPLLSTQSFTFYENNGSPYDFTISPATNPDGDVLTYSSTNLPASGSGTLSNCMGFGGSSNTDLSCRFTPVANTNNTTNGSPYATFLMSATDTNANTVTASLIINITSTNTPPFFTSRKFTFSGIDEHPSATTSTVAITLPEAMDLEDDPSTLIYSIVVPPLGTLTNCLGGTLDLICDYIPPPNRCGTAADFFSYMATDPESSTGSATVFFDISCFNSPPVATSTSMEIYFTASSQGLGAIPPATDSDGPPGDTLTYSVTIHPGRGTLRDCLGIGTSSNQDLNCVYQIDPIYLNDCANVTTNFDRFFYQVSDGNGGIATSSISLNLNLSSSNTPTILTSISNKNTTTNTGIYAVNFTVKEGLRCDEDRFGAELQVTSSNTTLISNSNIKIYYGPDRASSYNSTSSALSPGFKGTGGVTWVGLGDQTTPANSWNVYLDLIPTTNQTGTSMITINSRDTDDPATITSTSFLATVHNMTAQHRGWTDIKAFGPSINKNGTTVNSNGYIYFEWNPFYFSTSSSSLTTNPTHLGYNIYRSSIGFNESDFDFGSPLNSTIVIPINSVLSYQDTNLAFTSLTPTMGLLYWYRVVPVFSDGSLSISPQNYSALRVLLPPQNMNLVHRWAVNYDICKKMMKEPNISNHNRCDYIGPGNTYNTIDPTKPYYDLGMDLIVDRFEIGCPFTDNGCTDSLGDPVDCADNFPPTATMTNNNGGVAFYYDRSENNCYMSNIDLSNSDWKTIADLSTAATTGQLQNHTTLDLQEFAVTTSTYTAIKANFPHLPPLTHITQLEANNYCSSADFAINLSTDSATYYTISTSTSFSGRLPSRKEQIAISSWYKGWSYPSGTTDGNIESVEGGLQSNLKGCNSNNGSYAKASFGITPPEFLDDPDNGSDRDTYPSMYSTTVTSRIFRTGSDYTDICLSNYKIQDLVGNVREWISDRIICTNDSLCQSVYASDTTGGTSTYSLNNNDDNRIFYIDLLASGTSTNSAYHYDGISGPCGNNVTVDSTCNGTGEALTSWVFSDTTQNNNGANSFYFANGLATVFNQNQNAETIDRHKVHYDVISIQASTTSIMYPGLGLKGATIGGSYRTHSDYSTSTSILTSYAGVYAIEYIDSYTHDDKTTGFRCVVPVPNP